MLRDGRLAYGQALDKGMHGLLPIAELVEDVATARLGDHLDRCAQAHDLSML